MNLPIKLITCPGKITHRILSLNERQDFSDIVHTHDNCRYIRRNRHIKALQSLKQGNYNIRDMHKAISYDLKINWGTLYKWKGKHLFCIVFRILAIIISFTLLIGLRVSTTHKQLNNKVRKSIMEENILLRLLTNSALVANLLRCTYSLSAQKRKIYYILPKQTVIISSAMSPFHLPRAEANTSQLLHTEQRVREI